MEGTFPRLEFHEQSWLPIKLVTLNGNSTASTPYTKILIHEWTETTELVSALLLHLGDPVVVVPAPVDPVLQELDSLEQVVLEGGRLARREHVHPRERRGDEVEAVVRQVEAVVLPLLDYVLEHLGRSQKWTECVKVEYTQYDMQETPYKKQLSSPFLRNFINRK